jgi:uncharacterized protein YraI
VSEIVFMKRLVWSAAAWLLLTAPLVAHAADGFVTGNVSMRAGPDTQYPLIYTVPEGSAVSVQGCTSGWEWCDVIVSGNRGWVSGYYIQYQYQNQPVALPSYGAQIGVPIVSFVIATYWNNYYRNRPFYGQRNSWYSRPIPHRPPPRPVRPPSGHRPPPPGHRPPPAKPRPPVNRPQPKPPAGNRPKPQPKPQPRPPANRPQPGQRPPPKPSQPGNGASKPRPTQPGNTPPANKPGGSRPTPPPNGQGRPKPNPPGNNGGQ